MCSSSVFQQQTVPCFLFLFPKLSLLFTFAVSQTELPVKGLLRSCICNNKEKGLDLYMLLSHGVQDLTVVLVFALKDIHNECSFLGFTS